MRFALRFFCFFFSLFARLTPLSSLVLTPSLPFFSSSLPSRCLSASLFCFSLLLLPSPDGKGHVSACLLSDQRKEHQEPSEAGGGGRESGFSFSKKKAPIDQDQMSGFLSLLGLAPPTQRPSPARHQSPAREERPAPEFSLAELRRVHGVLLVSFFFFFTFSIFPIKRASDAPRRSLLKRKKNSLPPFLSLSPRPTGS